MTHTEEYPGEGPVLAGQWSESKHWEFYLSKQAPPDIACTAVACVAIKDIDARTVVLTRNKRTLPTGIVWLWEMLAGRTEPLDPNAPDGVQESPEQARDREALEEGGFVVAQAGPFGYSVVDDATRVPRLSIMRYYWGTTNQELVTPIDPKHTSVGVFTIDEATLLVKSGTMRAIELAFVRYGLAAALRELRGMTL